jgi:hypothetical protein
MGKRIRTSVLLVFFAVIFNMPAYAALNNSQKTQSNKTLPVKAKVQPIKTPVLTDKNISKPLNNIDYSGINFKKISDEITLEMEDEQEKILEDLRILWQSAIERSETVKFAIFKLSNPEGEKVDQSMVKKILSPIANVAPLIGIGTGIPIAEGSSIIGGGILNSFLADESAINSRLSKVTDADLIILAKEIETLQEKLICLYCNYITALEVLNFSDTIVKNRYENYKNSQNKNLEQIELADAFYRESLDQQYKARQDLLSSRAALEQIVGNNALIEIDKSIKGRVLSSL